MFSGIRSYQPTGYFQMRQQQKYQLLTLYWAGQTTGPVWLLSLSLIPGSRLLFSDFLNSWDLQLLAVEIFPRCFIFSATLDLSLSLI